MNIEKIKKIYIENKKVSFNLLGLDYTIEEKNDGVIIYEDMYKLKYKFFLQYWYSPWKLLHIWWRIVFIWYKNKEYTLKLSRNR